jgi:hypothetical protein
MTYDTTKTRSREIRSQWYELAACQGTDVDFEVSKVANVHRSLCERCPVKADCLREALDLELGQPAKQRSGIRGGLSPRQRWEIQRSACIHCQKPVGLSVVGTAAKRTCDECRERRRQESYAAYDASRRLRSAS